MLTAKLITDYNTKLMANGTVRTLMAALVQDPLRETVDLVQSKDSVLAAEVQSTDRSVARRLIIGWLNQLYFSDPDGETIPIQWWWEMHTRIQKLLVVSMVLESANLSSFGCTPQKTDIPQCLVGLQAILNRKQAQFPALEKQYLDRLSQMDSDFIKLYLS